MPDHQHGHNHNHTPDRDALEPIRRCPASSPRTTRATTTRPTTSGACLYERRMSTLHDSGSAVFLDGIDRIGLSPIAEFQTSMM